MKVSATAVREAERVNVPRIAQETANTLRSHPVTLVLIAVGIVPLILARWAVDTPWYWLWWLPGLAIYQLVIAALAFAVGTGAAGGRPSVIGSYRTVFARLPALVGYVVVYFGAVILIGATVVGFPFAVFLLVRWLFGLHAIVLRNVGIGEALGLSSTLVKGVWWQVFLVFLVVQITWGALSWAPLLAAGFTTLAYAMSVAIIVVTLPLLASVITHMFLQLSRAATAPE